MSSMRHPALILGDVGGSPEWGGEPAATGRIGYGRLLSGEESLMDLGLRISRALITGGSRGIGFAVAD